MAVNFNGFTKGDFLSCNGTKVGAERLARRMRQLAEVLAPQVSRLDANLIPVISPVYTDRNYRPNRSRPRNHACLIFVDRTLKRSPFPRLPQLGIYLHGDSLSIGLSAGWWPAGRLRLLLRSSRRQLRRLSHYHFFNDDVVVRSPGASPAWSPDLLDRTGRTFFVGKVFAPDEEAIASPQIIESILLILNNLMSFYRLLVKSRTPWNRFPPSRAREDDPREEGPAGLPERGEAHLLLDLSKYLENRAFRIDLPMLLNVYLAIKVKPFILLSGISGAGKSLLVRLLAEGINGVRDGNPQGYRLIPVRPDWQDRRDLLGFPNLLTGRYEMGDLLRAIQEAEARPGRPYFVCLDEMNLARVEHYFADILSVMETGRRFPDGRWAMDPLTLSPGSDPLVPLEDGSLPSRQPIPDNLVFFGTVNVDESTYPFSKKVLDRANTIDFNEIDLRLQPENRDDSPLNLDHLQHLGEFLSYRPYRKLPDLREGHPAVRWNQSIMEVNQILEPEDLHFGYRVRDEILLYMAYAIDLIESFPPSHSVFDEPSAFDFQILQKILPRLSGPGETLRGVLENLASYCEDRYPKSQKRLRTMLRRLERTGFTHFWSG